MKITKREFKSGTESSRITWRKYAAVLAFSLLALPVWAAHSDFLSWELKAPTTIGSTQFKPGIYMFRAAEGESELLIMQDNKVIARVPCQWTQLDKKAAYSEVKTLNDQIILLQFAGRKEARQFNP